MDGTTTMSTHERKASLREFYGNLLAVLTISAHQSFPLSSLNASYQQRQKLLISIDPDNIQISRSRKICAMCLVAPSLQTFPTSQLQWAGSGRKDLLVKRHHYIWELYIEACFCMIFQTFDLSSVQAVFRHRPRRVWLRVMFRTCSMHISIITAVARGNFGAGSCKTKGGVWGAL